MLVAFIAAAPMLVGYALFFNFNTQLTLTQILTGAVFAAFFEELYYRGILFGQLFRYTKLGFIPAIAVGAVLFAVVHLWQSQDPAVLIGVFFATFFGAILFAWLYAEWHNNLWVPIGLHFFMNLWWMVFNVADTAAGNNMANLFRVITIAVAIIGTIVYKRRKRLPLAVNRNTLLLNKAKRK